MLLTAVTESADSRLIRIGTAWFVIASLFEFGQHPSISPFIAASLPGFAHVPVLDNTAAYFLKGTFDPLDFLAIVLGIVANVTAGVASDLVSRSRSQYRLRFSEENSVNFQDDYVQFTDAEDSCCAANRPPQLAITIHP